MPDHALIDGLPVFPFPLPQTAIIGARSNLSDNRFWLSRIRIFLK